MEQVVALDQLCLSEHRHAGASLKVTPELRRRIQDHGFIDPVVVRPLSNSPGRYEILSNPEAYLAAGKLGIHQIPVVVRDDVDDEDAAEIVRAQYHQVKSNPIEEAEWYQERLGEDSTIAGGKPNIARLARVTGKSRSHISRSLALLKLPLTVQEYFREGRLSAAHGRFLCKVKSSVDQKRLAERAVRESLSVRDLENIVNRGGGQPAVAGASPSQTPRKDPDTLRLERQLSELVGCPISLDHASGVMSIDYFGRLDLLQGIIEKLGYSTDG